MSSNAGSKGIMGATGNNGAASERRRVSSVTFVLPRPWHFIEAPPHYLAFPLPSHLPHPSQNPTLTPRTPTQSSASSGKFAGLTTQKRNSSDAIAEARRQSFHEQGQKPGFIGQMWHNFTKGGGGK